MNLFCQSVDFRNCPAGTTDKLALDIERRRDFLCNIRDFPRISDALVLNTCNRLEFYFYAKKNFDVSSYVNDFISHHYWDGYKRTFVGIGVAEHLFRVAAGLESQIVGENEIFAQLKSAYSFALQCNSVNTMFHHLLHSAFRVAKAVRTDTNISAGALSIAQAAVELAADKIDIEKSKIIVVGSGSNAELIVKHLTRKKVRDFTVVARNRTAAGKITTGPVLPLNELETAVSAADIVFTAVSALEPLVKISMIENRTKPLILIDLSVPGGIESGIGKVPDIRLFNIDSLNGIIKTNNRNRRTQIPRAEAIINEHLRAFKIWRNKVVSPVITMTGSVVPEGRPLNMVWK